MNAPTPTFRYIPKGRARGLTTATGAPPPIAAALVLPDGLASRYARQKADTKTFQASAEQQAYFDWIEHGRGSLILRAVAGAGKSTTLIQGLQYMQGSVFLGAFGKDAATDLQIKAHKAAADRQGIHISTMHAAGFGAWRRAQPKVQVDDRKVGNLIDDMAAGNPRQAEIERAKTFIGKMVSFGKQFLFGCQGYPSVNDLAQWAQLCDHFSIDQDLPEDIRSSEALEWVISIFNQSMRRCADLIDFNDMIYAPIAFNIKQWQNDWVLIDEAQDCNPGRIEMARRLVRPGGRFVAVGDDRQAIFGFTGAAHDSLDKIQAMFGCQKLGLSVTYRCPKDVVAYVKTIDPEYSIQAHPDAIKGEVRQVKYEAVIPCLDCHALGGIGCSPGGPGTWKTCATCKGNKQVPSKPWFVQDPPDKADAILCRYTKPLITNAYAMIKAGIACKVEGRDIGIGLINLARLWRISSISLLEERLETYLKREVEKAKQKGSDRRQQEVEDKVATLQIFIDRCRSLDRTSINELCDEISRIFTDNVKDVITLSTGHKAKGREWNRVYWLQAGQRGRITKDWEIKSERNVRIVISTRALRDLILVPEEVHSKEERKK